MTPVSIEPARTPGPTTLPATWRPPAATPWQRDPRDLPRQTLLARSDDLLDELERLRLCDRLLTPTALRRRIDDLRADAGLPERPAPRSLAAAHDLLLSMQQRWLNLNPRHPCVTPPAPVATGGRWKHLPLPPCPPGGPDEPWRRLARATVERAFDRWCWAQHHATLAAREGGEGSAALRRAGAAWSNYFELRREALRLGAWDPLICRDTSCAGGGRGLDRRTLQSPCP